MLNKYIWPLCINTWGLRARIDKNTYDAKLSNEVQNAIIIIEEASFVLQAKCIFIVHRTLFGQSLMVVNVIVIIIIIDAIIFKALWSCGNIFIIPFFFSQT